ncbi:hypothetical protein VHEMI08073 [[Torrubiella] hemipterigena]|uniref:Major facilitator superfamily (MFS) profile domain-containing protein n=1 Tax=[Torrubiella] hemipterigena TaxID=1531966 RepID=A0A0A1TCA8_9HYPO|nr:hypothetical protein VHEMI08073 [[Torrubiella] hemipterigena]
MPTLSETTHDPSAPNAPAYSVIADEAKPQDSDGQPKAATANSVVPLAEWSTVTKYCTVVGTYVMILVVSLRATVALTLTPYMTSDFGAHSLIPLTNLLAYVVSAVVQLPLSRVISHSGHVYTLIAIVLVDTLGLVLLATCRTVEWYAAGFVMFETAFGGLTYILRLLIIDTVKKQHQAVAFGLTTVPYLITPFAGPPMAQAFLEGPGWRWAYGSFAIVMPVFGIAMVIVLVIGERSAKRQTVHKSKLLWARVVDYMIEIDVVGLILCCVGIGMLLVCITVATAGLIHWNSSAFISMLAISIDLLVTLVGYERSLASQPFVTPGILSDRCALGATLAISGQHMSYGIWFSYFTSYLQVVFYQSIRNAGYISNIYLLGWGISAGVAGLILHYTHRFKLVTAMSIAGTILSTGLILYCSKPGSSISGLIGCQVVFSISAGFISVSMMMGVLHKAKPGENPMRMALFFMISLLFSALGSTVSTAIWRNVLPGTLDRHLPEGLKNQATKIAGSIVVQLSYPRGSVGRDAIILAFAEAWRSLMIAGTSVLGLSVVGVLAMKEGQPSRRVESPEADKV